MWLRPLFLVAIVLGSPALGACAQGTQLAPTFGDGDGDGGRSNEGGNGGAGTGAGGAGGTGGSGGGGGGSETTTSSTSGMGGMGGAGGAGGSGGMGGGGGVGGDPCSFAAPNSCPSAEALPAVSGDEGDTSTTSGTGSKWFKVHVEETSSSIFGSDLSYKVTLSSPPGMDYDLLVRQGPQDGNPNCGAAEIKGTPSGSTESVSASWDDDQGVGGESDSLWLSIEVRHVSGNDCNAKWNLTVVGDP